MHIDADSVDFYHRIYLLSPLRDAVGLDSDGFNQGKDWRSHTLNVPGRDDISKLEMQ